MPLPISFRSFAEDDSWVWGKQGLAIHISGSQCGGPGPGFKNLTISWNSLSWWRDGWWAEVWEMSHLSHCHVIMLPNREKGMRKSSITFTVFKPAKCPAQVSQGMCNNSLEISKSWLYTEQFPWTQRAEHPEPPEKETESPFSTAQLLDIPFPFGSVMRWPDAKGKFFHRDWHWWSEAPAIEYALDCEPRPKPSLLLVSK